MIPLGKPLTLYTMAIGLALRKVDEEHYLCSFHDGQSNRKEVVHMDDIKVGGKLQEVNTKNEVEHVDATSCTGGGCAI